MWLRILIVLTEGNYAKPLEDSCVCLFVCKCFPEKKKSSGGPRVPVGFEVWKQNHIPSPAWTRAWSAQGSRTSELFGLRDGVTQDTHLQNRDRLPP